MAPQRSFSAHDKLKLVLASGKSGTIVSASSTDIGVSGRGDETSPEPLGVIYRPEHRSNLDLAAIARSCVNMTELERSQKIPRSPRRFINGPEGLGDTTGTPQCPPQL